MRVMSILSFIQDRRLERTLLSRSAPTPAEASDDGARVAKLRLAILIAEPRHVCRAARLARQLASSYDVSAIAVGAETVRAARRQEGSWSTIHEIDLRPTEEGIAEKIAAEPAGEIIRDVKTLPFPQSLLAAAGNELYMNLLLPLFTTCLQVRRAIAIDSCITLILLGGHRRAAYSPIFYAEGERVFSFLHHRSWLMNPHIQRLCSSGTAVEWQQTPRWLCSAVIRVRRVLALGIRMVGALRSWALHRRIPCGLPSTSERRRLVPILVRSESQFRIARSLYGFLKNKTPLEPLFVVGHTNMTQEYARDSSGHVFVSALRSLGLLRLLGTLVASCWGFRRIRRIDFGRCVTAASQGLALELDVNSIVQELAILLPDVLVRYEGLTRTFSRLAEEGNVSAVVTTELLAYGGGLQKAVAERTLHRRTLFVLQGVALARIPYPFWWGDVYLLSSREFAEYVHETGMRGAAFRYVGDFVACPESVDDVGAAAERHGVVLFTQPDDYSWLFQEIAGVLCDYLEESGNQAALIVKLHPRDRCSRHYRKLQRRYGFLRVLRDGDPFLLCQEASLAVTSTSTVLLDASRSGVPTIAFVRGDVDRVPEFVREAATRVVTSMQEFREALSDPAIEIDPGVRASKGVVQAGISAESVPAQPVHPCQLIGDLLEASVVLRENPDSHSNRASERRYT